MFQWHSYGRQHCRCSRGHLFLARHADNITVPVLHSYNPYFISIEYPVDWMIDLS